MSFKDTVMSESIKCQCLDHSGLREKTYRNEIDIQDMKIEMGKFNVRLDTQDTYIARTIAKASGYIAGAAMVVGVLFKLLGKYL
jgi:hypothetical protein